MRANSNVVEIFSVECKRRKIKVRIFESFSLGSTQVGLDCVALAHLRGNSAAENNLVVAASPVGPGRAIMLRLGRRREEDRRSH